MAPSRRVWGAALVLVVGAALAACAGPKGGPSPTPTVAGSLRPDASFTAIDLELIARLPSWVDRSTCRSLLADANQDIWAASVGCRRAITPFPIASPGPWHVSGVGIAKRKVAEGTDAFLARAEAAWDINRPEVSAAPSCAEGPALGKWESNGEFVGGLECTADTHDIEYYWMDERTGLYASVTFTTGDWAEAYRAWRRSGLDMMMQP